MSERQQKEVDYMTAREQRVDEYEQQLQEMRIQDAEEYNQVKIKLETDVEVSVDALMCLLSVSAPSLGTLHFDCTIYCSMFDVTKQEQCMQFMKSMRFHKLHCLL